MLPDIEDLSWKYLTVFVKICRNTGSTETYTAVNFIKNGEWKYCYNDGQIRFIRNYRNGVKHGKQIEVNAYYIEEYYTDGVLNLRISYRDHINNEITIEPFKDGKLHGFYYYRCHCDIEIIPYIHGQKHGVSKVYRNSEIFKQCNYVHGIKHGKFIDLEVINNLRRGTYVYDMEVKK